MDDLRQGVAPAQEDTAVVIGQGMIGQFSALFLRMYGCKVVVCDIDANRLDEAKKAGAAAVVNLTDSDAEERLLRLGNGGFDIVVEASGSIPGITLARKLLRRKLQNYSKDYKVEPIRFYGKDWPRLIVQATTWLLLCCRQIICQRCPFLAASTISTAVALISSRVFPGL